ncbi:MAG TPA: hypothetical protein VMZ22_13010 [Acidimicrobiales bacterium]|nr:hypothetical protein [Acidimicrobiales bacterium]
MARDGIWSAGLRDRIEGEPRCLGCGEKRAAAETQELFLLWRRSKKFRRRRLNTRG